MAEPDRPEDLVFAEHVIGKGYATEEQVRECLDVLERLRGELDLEESLGGVLLKKGYISEAQARAVELAIDPAKSQRARNTLPGYQLLERIGVGAMGAVYKAHHLKLDIPVAIKVLRTSLSSSRTQVERLKREAQLVARLTHPNVVVSRDVGEAEGFHYLVMEYVDGPTVRQLLRKGPFREKDALRIVRDVARALEHAHAQGIIHRDVKPGNIMLTSKGVVKLADFGLARGKQPSDLTLEHASVGTPQYVAPEQMRRAADATPRSDLFSLGASLYHMVTGRPPFDGENLAEIVQNVMACRFPPPERIVTGLGLDTLFMIHKLMRADPRERYQSATELLADLERLDRGERVAPSGFRGDHRDYLRRRRRRAVALLAVVLVAVGGAALLAIDAIHARREESARLRRCEARDRTGAGDLGKATTVPAVRRVFDAMREAARDAGCSKTELAGLRVRMEAVRSDLERLDRAEECLREAVSPEASFRTLDEEVRGLRDNALHPAVRDRIGEVVADIERKSGAAARNRIAKVYRTQHADENVALGALRALLEELRARHVDRDGRLAREVRDDLRAYEGLIRARDEARRIHGTAYRDARRDDRFADAYGHLSDYRAALDRVRGELESGRLGRGFLRFFEVPDDDFRELEESERTAFGRVEAEAGKLVKAGDAAGALRAVEAFRKRAHACRRDAATLLETIRGSRAQTLAEQRRRIEALERTLDEALARRDYAAWTAALGAQLTGDWEPEIDARLRVLKSRGIGEIGARLHRLAPELAARAARAGSEELERALAFDPARIGDTRLRGHFLAAETRCEPDPRRRLVLLRRALRDLRPLDDSWLGELELAEAATARLAAEQETAARRAFIEMQKALDRKDDRSALALCRDLLRKQRDGLRYTDEVEHKLDLIEDLRRTLVRRAGVEDARIGAGLPPGRLVVDAEAQAWTWRFDFREWWPDEHAVPDGVSDRREWLDQRAIPYWSEQLGLDPLPSATFERAKHQLLLFNDALVPDDEDGVARFDQPHDAANLEAFRLGAAPRLVELRSPVRLDAEWSLEAVVQWTEGAPVWFAVIAGEVQAGVLHATYPFGAGSGLAIFRQAPLVEGVAGRLAPLRLDPQDTPRRTRPLRRRDLARLEGFRFERGAWWRVRFEVKGAEVRFSLWREDEPAQRADVVLRLEPNARREALLTPLAQGQRAVIGFLPLTGCRWREIVVTGRPAGDG